MVLAYLHQDRLTQHLAVSQRHIGGDGDALLLAEFHHLAVLQQGVDLYLLVSDGAGTQNVDGFFKLGNREVGDPNFTGQAQGFGFGQLLQIDRHRHLVVGGRPMDQRQIQIVGAQFLKAGFQARDQLAFGKLAGPHLGGEVDI